MMPAPDRIAIIGLGLLGASLAEASRRQWPGLRISGVSSPATLGKALEAGLVDETRHYSDVDAAVAGCDLVFLCTPIDHIKGVLAGWAHSRPAWKVGCVVSDVGSTKAGICALGRAALPPDHPQGAVFIGSHPMAGSEKTGLEARDPLLFQNASWVLCPEADAPEAAVEKLQVFVESLGARTTRMDSRLHDAVAAHVSHLPQLLSIALASYIGGRETVVENCLQIAGAGFRDMTRLAGSSFGVWEPILKSNLAEVRGVAAGFRRHWENLEASLDRDMGAAGFHEANRLRGQLSTGKKGFSMPLMEILVDLEDKPGVLLRALQPLAENGLNVQDLEILKVREGEAGTLMMAFRRTEDARAALDLLAAEGFRARPR